MSNLSLISFTVVFSLCAVATFPFSASALEINEFASDTKGTLEDPDWVELYNDSELTVDLSGYQLSDGDGNKKSLRGTVGAHGFAVFNWSNRLNRDGDRLSLVESSTSGQIDFVAYGDQGDGLPSPDKGQTCARMPDGGTSWVILASPTKGLSNGNSVPLPSPFPISPEPTASLSPTPAPTVTLSTPGPTKSPKPFFSPAPNPVVPSPAKSPSPTLPALTISRPEESFLPTPSTEILGVFQTAEGPSLRVSPEPTPLIGQTSEFSYRLPFFLFAGGLCLVIVGLAPLFVNLNDKTPSSGQTFGK